MSNSTWKDIFKMVENGEITVEHVIEVLKIIKKENLDAGIGKRVSSSKDQPVINKEHGRNEGGSSSRIKTTPFDHKAKDLKKPDSNQLNKKVEHFLKEIISRETKIPLHKINSRDPFENYGIDSVMIVNLNRVLGSHFGELPKTLFFEYRNIRDLAGYFVLNHKEKVERKIGVEQDKTVNEVPVLKNEGSFSDTSESREFGKVEITSGKNLSREQDDIAIIGISGRFPMAKNVDEFWENLKAGRDCITEIPGERWDYKEYYDPDKTKNGKSNSKWGGFIDDVDKFDALFFNISPRDAGFYDPQERLFLEEAWHTFEDAGYTREKLDNKKVGVYVGVTYSHYQMFGAEESLKGNVIALCSVSASIANRVSYFMNLKGPSIGLDTMCSSSLTAIHLACESLYSGECEMALAGGVNLSIHPNKYIMLSQGKFMASDGRCRSFGDGGDGYVPGEGVGATMLKPLKKAIKDGDRIYAVIKGSAVNHGGKTSGYSVPNPNAQSEVISEVLKKSNIDPRTISYLEAHGTGTPLGDPIEISGLVKAFGEYTRDKQYCSIGSAKSNIGHLEAAAGIAGMIKILLQMKHEKLAPSIHSERLNPNLNFKETPFYLQRELEEWTRPEIDGSEYPRRAGISSFGAGGSNAHLLLEEYQSSDAGEIAKEGTPCVTVLSAKTEDRLNAYVKEMVGYLEKHVSSSKKTTVGTCSLHEIAGKDLAKIASNVINVDESEIDLSGNWEDYGFDAVNLEMLSEKINSKYGILINTAEFFKHPSLQGFMEHMCDEYFEQLNSFYKDVLTEEELKEKEKKENNGSRLLLRDIAYTTQVGREAMTERLAVEASTIQELYDKLNLFLQGEKDIPALYRGNARGNKSGLDASSLLDDEEGEEFVRRIIQRKKLSKIAKLWVSGMEIDWELLYGKSRPAKVSLPVYPFARERHWIPEGKKGFDKSGIKEWLHPLLCSNTSGLREYRFSSVFSGNEPFLSGRIIGGRRVFPEMACLEMAVAAGEKISEKKIKVLKDVSWESPVDFKKNQREIHVGLKSALDGLSFEIYSNEENKPRSVCSRGMIEIKELDSFDKCSEKLDIEKIRERAPKKLELMEINREYLAKDISYGPFFQSVKDFWVGETEALVELELSATNERTISGFVLHPSLMEGALHAVNGIEIFNGGRMLLFPAEVKELNIFGQMTDNCYVHASFAEIRNNVKIYNIQFADVSGRLLVQMRNLAFSTRRTTDELSQGGAIYFKNEWRPSESKLEKKQIGRVMVFDTSENTVDSLNKRSQIHTVSLVVPGDKFEEEGIRFLIDPENPEDYRRLFGILKQRGNLPDKIVHLWSSGEPGNLQKQLKMGVKSVFFMMKALLELKPSEEIEIFYIHSGDETENPVCAAVSGLAKTFNQENSKITCRAVMIPDYRSASDFTWKEIMTGGAEPEVLYKDGERLVKGVIEIDLQMTEATPLVKNGVYLITGGAGGLGLLFSAYLAREYEAKLILTGRSRLDDDKEKKLDEIRALGAEILYVRADISSAEDTSRLISESKSRFGRLNGIIHAAGMIKDSLLIKKTVEDFNSVVSPKVHGTINLDEATKDEPLDFFVMFSSISAVRGNIGQGDYAYANSFLDCFARSREGLCKKGKRFGKTLSINWPLWRDGGMRIDEAVERMMMKTMGISPLEKADGLKAFLTALSQPENQIIVVSGERQKVRDVLTGNPASDDRNDKANLSKLSKEELLDTAYEYVRGVLSEELQIEKSAIEDDVDITEYGVDSIIAVKLLERFQENLGRVPVTMILENTTLKGLASYVLSKHIKYLEGTVKKTGSGESVLRSSETGNSSRQNETITLTSHVNVIKDDPLPSEYIRIVESIEPGMVSDYFNSYGDRYRDKTILKKRDLCKKLEGALSDLEDGRLHQLLVKTSQGANMEVFTLGKGAPILFVPAAGLTVPVWARQFLDWSSTNRLMTIHHPGYGLSEIGDDIAPLSIIKIFIEVLETIGVKRPVHVIASCFGGISAQLLAKEFPDKIGSITLVGSFHKNYGVPSISIEDIPIEALSGLSKMVSEWLGKDLEVIMTNSPDAASAEYFKKCYEVLFQCQCVSPLVVLRYMAQIFSITTEELLPQILPPAFCVTGNMDSLIPPEMSRLMSSLIPNARYDEIGGAGHYPYISHAEEFNEKVIEFIRKHEK